MCAHATSNTASSSPFAATRQSLLTRITNPLRSRTRNLTDFYIRPDEAHRQYSPGDLVKGAVVLTVVKPIRITHLTVCLHGFVRVFKSPSAAKESLPIDAGLTASTSPRKSQYFGNGHASLFQDEQTLSGEGRLEPGIYEFNFELEFPSKGLPTSIDFERGTISYMITATVTRPTSIAATSSCDQKISLVETVDIGPMNPPRPRTISLEPISRRSRRRKSMKTKEAPLVEAKDTDSESTKLSGSPLPEEFASQCGSMDHITNPQSPAQSDVHSIKSTATSAESTVSGSTSFRPVPNPAPARSTRESQFGSKTSIPDKTITATIELLKSGCLAGDNIPLKISIKHTKAIKSMHGIIITLYRQGRIDSAPPLSLFTDIKGKAAEKLKHDEYYPKSKTGLGGLSLSSAGSSSLFRKDLAQTFAPLLVDPTTLTTVVTASVRVPEDVFPTIKGVPGEMISFRYHLEVVVDLGGKLAGQQRHLPRVGAVTLPSNYGTSATSTNANMLAAWGGSIVDTDHIRREKSVVACLFEVVVGSTDSARRRGRGNSTSKVQMNGLPDESTTPPSPHDPIYDESPIHWQQQNGAGQLQYDQNFEGDHSGYYVTEGYSYDEYEWYPEEHLPNHAQIPIPPPDIHEEGLTEKEQARRAEERLLPSQPPQDTQASSSSRVIAPLVAPPASLDEDAEDLYSADDATPRANPTHFQSLDEAATSSDPHAPSAPSLEDLNPAVPMNPAEDKQELERQRLLAEASAPPELSHDEEGNASEGSSGNQQMPSAPIMKEEENYGRQYAHSNLAEPSSVGENLPGYER